ncbi:MAG: hypothetical protein IPH04_01065 [Saprospirales bacterium]|nr:hypothetical protein [Saprospirales bacterium]
MELLEEKHPGFRFDAAERHLLSTLHDDDETYERALFDLLSKELQREGKKVVLFIDNFGDLARKMSDAEAHRLRKILQTSSDIRIFAASAIALEAFYRYDHPFYEFFKVVELKGLDKKETRDLLLRLSEHYKKESVAQILEKQPGRVEALRRITGGVIRTMVLLFEIFADDDDGSAFKDLEVVLDRVTPLYKHRMDDLSDQQQAIVEAIALNWDALSVKEIAERTRLESKIISAQLQNLEKNGIVQKIPTRTKNHLYIVTERFFNIWFLMRNGRRGDEKRVLWLVRFFEEWCDGDMMKTRAHGHRSALLRGGFDPEAAYLYTLALTQTGKLTLGDEHELIRDTQAFLTETAPNLEKGLSPSVLDLVYEAIQMWFKGEKEKAVEKLDKSNIVRFGLEETQQSYTISKASKQLLAFWEKEIPGFVSLIGAIFNDLNNPDVNRAEQCWQWASSMGDTMSMVNLGVLYKNKYNDLFKAEELWEKAASDNDVLAMFNLGAIYQFNYNDPLKAKEWYEKAASAGNAMAMNNLGIFYKIEEKDFLRPMNG